MTTNLIRSNKVTPALLVVLLVSVTSALEVSINEDFYQQHLDDLNPCRLNMQENASGYCFCGPDDDPVDLSTVETVKCGFQRNPSPREWASLGLLHRAYDVEIMNRPLLALNEFPPPMVFTGIMSLNYFTIKSTAVSSIPSWAFNNSTSLSDIDMHDNNIHTLSSHAIANLVNLTVIKLNNNNLTEINRHVFVNLPKLRELWLMKNGIQIVHDNALRDLRSLKDLSLRDNRVSVITRETFSGLQNLANLDLHGNVIEYIGDHVFAEMPRLQDLDLSENMIKEVSSTAFEGLTKLLRLNLRDNKIIRLQPATFSHLGLMFFLDLKNNELEALPEAVAKPIYKNLKNDNMQLYLTGNRFMCDCHILWVQEMHNATESTYLKNHLETVTCNLFESPSKQDAAVAAPSSTLLHSDIKILTEETTTYAFESEKYILNLTAKDLNCNEPEDEMDNGRDKNARKTHDETDGGHRHTSQHSAYDTPYSTHHHQQQHPKLADERVYDQSHKHKPSADWDTNNESHQRDHHGMSSEENPGAGSGAHHHHHPLSSSLNEPQATAALEGADVSGSATKRTSTGDQKVDATKVGGSNHHHHDSSSTGTTIPNCDSCFVINILVSICIALLLK